MAREYLSRTSIHFQRSNKSNNHTVVEARGSNGIETSAHEQEGQRSEEAMMDRTNNSSTRGKLISLILGINILFLGCAIIFGSAFNRLITAAHRQIYLIVLLLLTMLWMIFHMVHTFCKHQNMMNSKDIHAAPAWLRGGLVLFGLLSLLMDILKICSYVGYVDCDSGKAIKIALPVVQAVFLFVQTYFFLAHAKDCVLVNKGITWCGLAITLSTNLVIWMEAVTEESLHQTEIPNFYKNFSHKLFKASYGDKSCKCNESACKIFKGAYHYVYPFNIQYSLFASAMAYVMWKNVGRIVDDHNPLQKLKYKTKEVCLGPIAGVAVVLAGLVMFVFYEVQSQTEDDERNLASQIYFITNIVSLCLMCASTIVGCVVYGLDRRKRVYGKSPMRSLDVGLLTGLSLGQFLISYFIIVAEVATGSANFINALTLTWAVLLVIQIGLQNYFIIEGLHREAFCVQPSGARCYSSVVHQHSELGPVTEGSHPPPPVFYKLNWKRRVLKEVCVFLMLANVILWVMPAFGARPHFDQTTEIVFYKFTMWATIVNIGLPFVIFYRLLSVAILFEVYLNS